MDFEKEQFSATPERVGSDPREQENDYIPESEEEQRSAETIWADLYDTELEPCKEFLKSRVLIDRVLAYARTAAESGAGGSTWSATDAFCALSALHSLDLPLTTEEENKMNAFLENRALIEHAFTYVKTSAKKEGLSAAKTLWTLSAFRSLNVQCTPAEEEKIKSFFENSVLVDHALAYARSEAARGIEGDSKHAASAFETLSALHSLKVSLAPEQEDKTTALLVNPDLINKAFAFAKNSAKEGARGHIADAVGAFESLASLTAVRDYLRGKGAALDERASSDKATS
jgi:hypothetical protein